MNFSCSSLVNNIGIKLEIFKSVVSYFHNTTLLRRQIKLKWNKTSSWRINEKLFPEVRVSNPARANSFSVDVSSVR